MPGEYRIRVEGALGVERVLGRLEKDVRREMRVASERARPILQRSAERLAPTPREGVAEEQGQGIYTELSSPRRTIAGSVSRAQGGGFLVDLEFRIFYGVEENTVSAYAEAGTGEHRDPEFGGPRDVWIILPGGVTGTTDSDSMLLGPMYGHRGGTDRFFAPMVRHPGARPHPFLTEAGFEVADEIEALYERAVSRATRRA